MFSNILWWKQKIKESVEKINMTKVKGDIRIHNLIIVRDEFKWIDLDYHGKKMTIYEDIKNMEEIM